MTSVATRPEVTERPGVLHQPAFRLLWIGETTSALGSSVTSVALPLVAITTLHTGVVAVSLLAAAAWLPWLVIGLPAGAWIDRMPRRPVMIACDAVSLAAFVSVPVAAWLGVLTLAQLLGVALLAGVAKVFFSTAQRAYVPTILHRDDLVDGNARLFGAESAAQVAGPGLGGVLAQAFGAATGLLADAVSFLVSLVCVRRLPREAPVERAPRRALGVEIAEGVRFVARDRLLRVYVTFGALANLVLIGYGAITVPFLVHGLGVGAATAGVLLAVGQVGGVVGAFAAPTLGRRLGSARATLVLKLGATPFGLLIALSASAGGLWLFLLGSFGMVGAIVGGNVIAGGFVQAYCPQHLFGRITTSMQFVNFGAMPVGAVLGGVLAGALGFGAAMWVLFGGFLLASLILLGVPELRARDLPTHP